MKTINIGGASGFWGDSFIAAPQLLGSNRLNYLVFDYLAEITMSIMARARSKDAEIGYATDFVTVTMRQVLPDVARQGVKVISNAGGVNPAACARALESVISDLGLDLKVATVEGDDLIDRVEDFRAQGVREMFSGEEMPEKFMSMNVYLGAFPIAAALDAGADIVLTGRCVDSAVTLGACIHEFGWKPTDYDLIAAGSLAGHIIECGAQATGGLFTDWELSENWENVGYPIAEVRENGEFAVSKPDGTGGIVSPASVAEQLVYEIGDPQAYILPDVICDFTEVTMEQDGDQRVTVKGTKGLPPTDTLKVSGTYFDGFRITCPLVIRGIDAEAKCKKTFESVLKRVRRMLADRRAPDFTEVSMEFTGTEVDYGPHSRIENTREVAGRLAAKHPSQEALGLLLRELTSSGTSMSPGTTGGAGTRPKPSPVVRLFSLLVPKSSVTPVMHFQGQSKEVPFETGEPFDASAIERPQLEPFNDDNLTMIVVPLIRIAHGRSGDKGNDANIGIIARKPEFLPIIRQQLTEQTVGDYLAHLHHTGVTRYDLPGLNAVNFLFSEILGGGGIASLRQDPQGKAYAQLLLDMPVHVPAGMVE